MIDRARSFLFVPGQRADRFDKALNSAADAIIIDLEDAVPLTDKLTARNAISAYWPQLDALQRARLCIRINGAESLFFAADLELVKQLQPAAIMLAKAESPADLQHIANIVGPRVGLIPLIESALGFANANLLAAMPQVCRLALGNIDFQADMGMLCGPEEVELQPVRFGLVLASRLAGIAAPIDGVSLATDDVFSLKSDTLRGRRFGFSAKLCIHPAQINSVHQAYLPTEEELDWARRVVAASASADGGAVKLDGKMIDRPVLLLAQRKLALAGEASE